MGIERKTRTARLGPDTDAWCVWMAEEVFFTTVSDFINLRLTWDRLMYQAGLIAPTAQAVHVYLAHNRTQRTQPTPKRYEAQTEIAKRMA